ncbi:ABC transporter [Shewanella putrefaciens]|nr:ABC transporter [Shewanella putrefaciens]
MRASTDSDYLTLTMQNCDSEKLLQEIAKLSGVINISSKQTNVFIIQLNNKDKHKEENFPTHYDVEIALLSLLDSHQWQYKMLLRGRTLEETLFS